MVLLERGKYTIDDLLTLIKDDVELFIVHNSDIDDMSFSVLSNKPSLTKIEIVDTKVHDTDMTHLSNNKNIHSIRLQSNNIDEIDLSPLDSCPRLRRLHITYNDIDEINFSFTMNTEPTNVQCIDLSRVRIDKDFIDKICNDRETFIIDDDVKNLFGIYQHDVMSMLSEVSLVGNMIETVDLSPLSVCDSLRYIDLSKNPIEIIDITPLIGIRSLRWIKTSDDQLITINNNIAVSDDIISPAIKEMNEQERIYWL